jgi:hypothetical protein
MGRGLWIVLVVVMCVAQAGCGEEDVTVVPAALVTGHEVDAREVGRWIGPFAPPEVRFGTVDGRLDLGACRRAVERRLRAARPSRGVRRSRERDPRRLCRMRFHDAKAAALGYVIRTQWLELEARRRSVLLAEAEVRRELRRRVASVGGTETIGDYLARSGMTRKQFEERVRRDVLFRRLMVAVVGGRSRVTQWEMEKFYTRNRDSFRRPRMRELRVVVTKSRRDALEARRQLLVGRPWDEVARRFTVDASSRTGGRVSIGVDNTIPALRRAVFSASIGVITGPARVRGLWWVFRPLRELPGRQMSLDEVAPRIRTAVQSTNEQLSIDRFLRLLDRKYRRQTVCIGEHTAAECGRRRAEAP